MKCTLKGLTARKKRNIFKIFQNQHSILSSYINLKIFLAPEIKHEIIRSVSLKSTQICTLELAVWNLFINLRKFPDSDSFSDKVQRLFDRIN